MRPLRPDTDLRLGKPLPYQLANQPRPPPKADCSFDLAMLCGISLGFPRLSPTQGQVVTCYSPGRHYTHGLLHFPVRLACVRHAASVDSEPGSNSHLKPELVWVDQRPPSAVTKVLSCEYVQTLWPEHFQQTPNRNRSPRKASFVRGHECPHHISRLARSTFCQRPTRFPPERCAFSPSRLAVKRKRHVLETRQSYRVQRSTVNPLRSQDFHLISTVRGTRSRMGCTNCNLLLESS